MIGPLTKELLEKNRTIKDKEHELLVQEIETFYVLPGVPPPALIQLSHPKQVIEAYENHNTTPPKLTLKKSQFLFWLETFKSITFLTCFFFVFKWVVQSSNSLPFLGGIMFATGLIFGSLILISIISKAIEKYWDKKTKKNWATIFYSK